MRRWRSSTRSLTAAAARSDRAWLRRRAYHIRERRGRRVALRANIRRGGNRGHRRAFSGRWCKCGHPPAILGSSGPERSAKLTGSRLTVAAGSGARHGRRSGPKFEGRAPQIVRRRLGDIRAWQRGGTRRGAVTPRERSFRLCEPTMSRLWPHAAGRLCQGLVPPPHDGVYHLHRARSHESGDGCPPVAHVNRLPVLLLPADVFATRAPDPVAAADRGFQRRTGNRERLPAAAVAVLRSHHATGAAGGGLSLAPMAGVDGPGDLRSR